MRAPVFVNCRDRLAPLRELVAWLERAGCDEIYFVDNDSAYEPLLEYYRTTPHTVIRLGENYGKFSLWQAPGVLDRANGRHFVYTDPDIVPVEECPLDALERFRHLLDRYPQVNKVGFGLKIDDLPDHYRHRETVRTWEQEMWRWPVERGAYYAPIDTTFALYRPGAPAARPAIRTGPPYVARHEAWYMDTQAPTEEQAFYAARAAFATAHATGMAHWTSAELPPGVGDHVAAVAAARPSAAKALALRAWWLLRGRRTLRRPAQDGR